MTVAKLSMAIFYNTTKVWKKKPVQVRPFNRLNGKMLGDAVFLARNKVLVEYLASRSSTSYNTYIVALHC